MGEESTYLMLSQTSCMRKEWNIRKTQPHTPHRNGVAKRKINRTSLEKARSLAIGCHLPIGLWSKPINKVIYFLSCSSTRANQGTTPYEHLFCCIPSVTHLKTFGCLVYIFMIVNTCKKWEDKALKCVLLSYSKPLRDIRFTTM